MMPTRREATTLNALKARAQAKLANAALQIREAIRNDPQVSFATTRPRFNPATADMLHFPPENIFRHLPRLRIPATAYVAGAGPLLLDELDMIPDGSFVIACNRAIMAGYPYRLWMAFDVNCPKYDWFRNPPPGDYIRVYGNHLRKLYPGTLWFSSRKTERMFAIAEGGLQGGGTIVGCALQLLYWAGCTTAVMLGAPMKGRYHFDGTTACGYQGTWKQAHRCRSYIDEMALGGMTTVALHENGLNIPILENLR